MNLYLVASEPLSHVVWEDWFNRVGHDEPYGIAELVIAESPNQAKWCAWKADEESFTGDVRDIPKMSATIRMKHIFGFGKPEIVSDRPEFQSSW